jgi:hypothetical protein
VHEKRRHPRVPINLPVTCEISGRSPFVATAGDLSVGGLLVRAAEVPPFGTELTIVGDFPGTPGLRLPAVVRWASPGGFGAQFLLLGARETHALIAIMQKARV